ncbi:YGR102C [Saccharomyces arboricola H-6]|uniref:Glutamyl-tRNA(Gln) amidotransferase subunit F, mitochondrial n=1 Tax=Saccharomyces arboricola (strain H-6 / AS 2.3317 / CBS 10644) TaxID=1160507 RepID=J8Q7Y4_SACAR|nr:YGR102C [Saccharomyces arboricola H-6]
MFNGIRLCRIPVANGLSRICSHRLASTGRVEIGKKFENMDQIRDYLSEHVWSVHEYLGTNLGEENLELPPVDFVKRLLRLSGLPLEGADIEGIQMRLAKQLSFINRMHNIPVAGKESMKEYDARLVQRETAQLSYENLLEAIACQEQDAEIGEVSGSWKATELAAESKNGYFVVKEGLLKNRK